jgi:integrase
MKYPRLRRGIIIAYFINYITSNAGLHQEYEDFLLFFAGFTDLPPHFRVRPVMYAAVDDKILSDRCGIHNLHPHKRRHTFASIAITNGADVASVSETLGHSDKAVTLRMYTRANEETKRKVSNLTFWFEFQYPFFFN